MAQRGRPKGRKFDKMLSVLVDGDAFQDIETFCSKREITISSLIREYIRKGIEDEKSEQE